MIMERENELIKNLKVYDRVNREKNLKQRKKSHFKLRLASLAITVSLLLSGCGGYNEFQQKIYDAGKETSISQTQIVVEQHDIESPSSDSENKEEEKSENIGLEELPSIDLQYYNYIINQTISFSPTNVAAVKNISNSINPVYPFSNISNISESYNRYQQVKSHPQYEINQKIINGELTAQELYSIVIKNNTAYKNENKYSIHGNLEDSYVLSICEVICDTLKNEIPKLEFKDNLDDLSYSIFNLCIFKSATTANAMLTDDNCLIVAPTQISNYASLNNVEVEVVFKKSITHEIEHLIQKISSIARKDLNINRGYGFMYSFDDVKVNSMYWNWLIESSAEQLAVDYYGINPMSYTPMINYLNTLILINSFDDNFGVKDIPRLTQQSDINKLFSIFGCNSNESKMELLNMMYAIEIIQIEPEDFFEVYNGQLGREAEYEEVTQMKIELKNSLCQTFTKYFYNNLSSKLQGSLMSVEDIYKLISLYEADLNMHISYSDETRFDSIKEFMESYLLIQDEFFEQVSSGLGLDINEIRSGYAAYNSAVTSPRKSILHDTTTPGTDMSIELFNQEKNSFLNTVFTNVGSKKTDTISQTYINYSKNYQK